MEIKVIFTDGSQPVDRGIGPALEAKDIISVLQGDKNAPQDLRERALTLAGHVLEFSPKVNPGKGKVWYVVVIMLFHIGMKGILKPLPVCTLCKIKPS